MRTMQTLQVEDVVTAIEVWQIQYPRFTIPNIVGILAPDYTGATARAPGYGRIWHIVKRLTQRGDLVKYVPPGQVTPVYEIGPNGINHAGLGDLYLTHAEAAARRKNQVPEASQVGSSTPALPPLTEQPAPPPRPEPQWPPPAPKLPGVAPGAKVAPKIVEGKKRLAFECEVCDGLIGVKAQDGLCTVNCFECGSEYLVLNKRAFRLGDGVKVTPWSPVNGG